jgi:hypothetical protein
MDVTDSRIFQNSSKESAPANLQAIPITAIAESEYGTEGALSGVASFFPNPWLKPSLLASFIDLLLRYVVRHSELNVQLPDLGLSDVRLNSWFC